MIALLSAKKGFLLPVSTAACIFLLTLFILPLQPATAQTQPDVFRQRAEKIVQTLDIKKEKQQQKITGIIAGQYQQLNLVHDHTKAAIGQIKKSGNKAEETTIAVQALENKKTTALEKLHRKFLRKLDRQLTAEQLEKVKDGMTYNVLQVTYTAYQDMIPSLTEEQKRAIYSWLYEAREKAMDEGSSEDKHKMFGKYKGRINNYLSAQGYDMKAEEKAWQQRLKEKRGTMQTGETPRQNS